MENKRYCTQCGKELDSFVTVCPVCGRQLDEKENLLKDWLYRNTKENVRGKIDDSLFSVVKNWLLCHLYGVVVAVTVIASAVLASRPTLPGYVSRTGLSALPSRAPVRESGQSRSESGTAVNRNDVYGMANDYATSCFFHKNAGDVFFDEDPSDYAPPEAYYAPASVLSPQRHEFQIYTRHGASFSGIDDKTYTLDHPYTQLGKDLKERGYTVSELIYDITYHKDGNSQSPPDLSESYQFVFVELDGGWYLVEDWLIEY